MLPFGLLTSKHLEKLLRIGKRVVVGCRNLTLVSYEAVVVSADVVKQ